MALAPVWASIWPILTTSWADAGVAAGARIIAIRAAAVAMKARIGWIMSSSFALSGIRPLQQPLGDDLLHDLRRPRRDGPQPHVAEEALDRELPHVAVAAVHLDRLIRHPVRDLGPEELGHGALGDPVLPPLLAPPPLIPP